MITNLRICFGCNSVFAQDPKHAEVKVLRDRLVVLNETDQALAEIFKFNQELAEFDKTLTSLQGWCDGKAKVLLYILYYLPLKNEEIMLT